MTEMERIEDELVADGTIVDDQLLGPGDPTGLYMSAPSRPPLVLINRKLTGRRKLCVLAEEAGHHYKSCGWALEEHDATQRRNELAGRRWAYQRLVPLDHLICAWSRGCRTRTEMATYFGVTEDFFDAALSYYHAKHGTHKTYPGWIIQFDPCFTIRRVCSHQ